MRKITSRLTHAWNAFKGEEQSLTRGSASSRPVHKTINFHNKSTYISSIFNRIAIDVAMVNFNHVKVNPENEDVTIIRSGLNECMSVEANIDQSHIQFFQDLVFSMFDEGVVAVVPVDTNLSPNETGGYDILSMRVGKILTWYPKSVEIELYNDQTGQNERIFMAKRNVAIIENPLYSVVNSDNSTFKRLLRKMSQLDNVDDLIASGRLDLLISIPYAVKTTAQEAMAIDRINSIEKQLASGKNGIAYIDGTEKVTQLNRPANSQLKDTIKDLAEDFHNQVGITQNIMNGTAKEHELRTYYSRSVDPIVDNIVSEFRRKFITKTARTQGQTIVSQRDMFKIVPIEILANLSDTLRRNEIASSNEIRRIIGMKSSNDPRADEIFNPNIADKNQIAPEVSPVTNDIDE